MGDSQNSSRTRVFEAASHPAPAAVLVSLQSWRGFGKLFESWVDSQLTNLGYTAHSSRGLGRRPLKAEITGSNPVCATILLT